MEGMIWRILWAVIAAVLVWALLPPLTRIFHITLSADVLQVITICVAALAVFFVLRGRTQPPA